MAELNLPNIREGGNIRFRIGLEDGGVAVDWSGLEDIRVFLYADAQKQVSGEMCEVAVDEEDNTVLKCKYSGDDVQYRGINSVLVRAKYLGEIKVYDKPAINIVARTSDATGVVEIDDPVVPVQISVEDVSTSLLNNAIDAAINAAAGAEKAIEDVRDEETAIQEAEAARVLAEQGRVSAEQSRVAQASADHTLAGQDHTRAESDHGTASDDHTLAVSDHGVASGDHTTALGDHSLAESDHTRAESDHGVAGSDHTIAQGDHTQAGSDHSTAVADHTQAGADHTVAGQDHTQAGTDHNTAASDHTQAGLDHTQAGEDHTQALADHQVMAGYDNRLGAVEGEVDQLEAKVTDLNYIENIVSPFAYVNGKYINSVNGRINNATGWAISNVFEIEKFGYIENLVSSNGIAAIAYLRYGQLGIYDSYIGAHIVNSTATNPALVKREDLTIPSGTNYFVVCANIADIAPIIHLAESVRAGVEELQQGIPMRTFTTDKVFVNNQYFNTTTGNFVGPSGIGTFRRTDLFNLDYFDKIEVNLPPVISSLTPNAVIMDKNFTVVRTIYFIQSGYASIVRFIVKKNGPNEKYVFFQNDSSQFDDTCKIVAYVNTNGESNGEPPFHYHLKKSFFIEPRTNGYCNLTASATLNDKSNDEFLAIYLLGNGSSLGTADYVASTALEYFATHKINVACIDYQGHNVYGVSNGAWGNDMTYNAVVDFVAYLQSKYSFRKEVILIGTSMGGLTMGELAYKRPFPVRFCFGNGPAPGLEICWNGANANPTVKAKMREAYGLSEGGGEDSQFPEKAEGCDWFKMGAASNSKVGFPNVYIYYGLNDNVVNSLFGGVSNYTTIKDGLQEAGCRCVLKEYSNQQHSADVFITDSIIDGIWDKEIQCGMPE